MEVINELLGYPNIKIIQETEAFNFSLDSMILADFVTIKKSMKKIVDLGTGNAPIPLYLTLRTQSEIIGVEIQKNSYDLALKSVMLNNKQDQITLLNDDIRGINKKIGMHEFDLVICNPPFFKYHESSNICKNDYKTIARHEVMLNLDELCREANLLLKNGATFAMVHRPDRLSDIMSALKENGFDPKRIRLVYPKENKNANHILIEAKKTMQIGGLKVLPPLIIHNDDASHTDEILKVYNKKREW